MCIIMIMLMANLTRISTLTPVSMFGIMPNTMPTPAPIRFRAAAASGASVTFRTTRALGVLPGRSAAMRCQGHGVAWAQMPARLFVDGREICPLVWTVPL